MTTNMSNEEQIDRLNEVVKARIAPSKIAGVGVFAIRDIGKGQKMWFDTFAQIYPLPYSYFSKLFPEVRELLIERWPSIVYQKGREVHTGFAYPDAYLQGYINHSDDPNYNFLTDIAIKDIKAGEEITEDYRQIPGWQALFTWLVKVKTQKSNEVKPKKTRQVSGITKDVV